MTNRRARSRAGTVLAGTVLAGLVLTLAACGGTPSDPGIATLQSGAAASASATAKASGDDGGLKFAQCMREHGVQMDDPVDGRITINGRPGDEAKLDAAQKACAQYSPVKEGGPQLSQADKTKFLKYAQCMREHGVPMQDPDFSGGGVKMLSPRGDAPIDETKLAAADQACQGELPEDMKGDGPSTRQDSGGPGAGVSGASGSTGR